MKARITTHNLKTISLEDGSSVTIKGGIDYLTLEKYFAGASMDDKTDAEKVKFAIDFMKSVVVGWNFVDDKGSPIVYKPELLENLDMETIADLTPLVLEAYSPEKKSSKT